MICCDLEAEKTKIKSHKLRFFGMKFSSRFHVNFSSRRIMKEDIPFHSLKSTQQYLKTNKNAINK